MLKNWIGEVIDGKIKMYDQEGFNNYVKSLNGPVEVTIQKKRIRRSLAENSYYSGVVIPILSNELGYTTEEMRIAIRLQFLVDNSGKLPKIKSTKDLTTKEFEDLMSQIRIWASSELHIYIPEPNEVTY